MSTMVANYVSLSVFVRSIPDKIACHARSGLLECEVKGVQSFHPIMHWTRYKPYAYDQIFSGDFDDRNVVKRWYVIREHLAAPAHTNDSFAHTNRLIANTVQPDAHAKQHVSRFRRCHAAVLSGDYLD